MPKKHKLQGERTGRGLTQKALGEQAGVSPSTISHIECHRGPDVPRSQLRKTKTRLSTALKLTTALSSIAPGEYSFDEFVRLQDIFTEVELYEALVNVREREARRRRRKGRHLHSVA